MIQRYRVVRSAARAISEAAEGTLEALAEGRIEQEPAFTDRMLGRIEQAMNGYRDRGVRWTAKTLTDRGRNSQESEFGADFAGVVDINVRQFKVNKGFLAQAKLIEPTGHMPSQEWRRMVEQCDRMLGYSSDAFVFLYSIEGISVVPAIAVVGADSNSVRNPHELYPRSLTSFYEAHFECFVGDRAISVAGPQVLDQLRERFSSRSALYLSARNG